MADPLLTSLSSLKNSRSNKLNKNENLEKRPSSNVIQKNKQDFIKTQKLKENKTTVSKIGLEKYKKLNKRRSHELR